MTLNLLQIAGILKDAAKEHHKFESETLNGVRDPNWDRWYAQYFIDAVSMSLSSITRMEMVRHIIHDVAGEGDAWFNNAAKALLPVINA